MADSNLSDLDPRLQPLAQQFLTQCAAAGLKVRIIVTYRNSQDQDEAHAKGLSKALGGQSPHNVCLDNGTPASRAFDFGCFMPDGTYITSGLDPAYSQAAEIAKGLGLVWGGDFFSFKDYDHCELANWCSI
jgi:peptidoglycan LD-endopeptidase CwlK